MTTEFDQNSFIYLPYPDCLKGFDKRDDLEDFDFSFQSFKIFVNLQNYCETGNKRNFKSPSDILRRLNFVLSRSNIKHTQFVLDFLLYENVDIENNNDFSTKYTHCEECQDKVKIKLSIFNDLEDELTTRLYIHLLYCKQHNKKSQKHMKTLMRLLNIKEYSSASIFKPRIEYALNKIRILDPELSYKIDSSVFDKFQVLKFIKTDPVDKFKNEYGDPIIRTQEGLKKNLLWRLSKHTNIHDKILYVGKIECAAIFNEGSTLRTVSSVCCVCPLENSDGFYTWYGIKIIPVDLESYFHVTSK